jgi:DnaJ-class molecular chaperone
MASTSATLDYYAILKVAQTATHSDIKASYRHLAMKHHPDKDAVSQDATVIMQKVRDLNN